MSELRLKYNLKILLKISKLAKSVYYYTLAKENNMLKVSPVYDNGSSFYNKSSDEKLINFSQDPFKFKQSVYDS